jgi:hypothetical protein
MDQGLEIAVLFSNVDSNFARLSFVQDEGENSSSCDIEHTE